MLNGLTPYNLSDCDCVPTFVHEDNPYSLINASDLPTSYAYTSLYYTSFFLSTVRGWNSLPNHDQTRFETPS